MASRIIDDQDLSSVTYQGVWAKLGSIYEHDGTTSSTTRIGDSFVVSFSGNAIAVYGTIDQTSGGVQGNYSIDGAEPQTVTTQAGLGSAYNQQFWRSPNLRLGQHSLNVTMVKINRLPKQPAKGTVWFDYFLIESPAPVRPPKLGKKHHIGAIVGGAIGGVALLLLVALAFYILRGRQRRRRPKFRQPVRSNVGNNKGPSIQTSETQGGSRLRFAVEPFILSPDHTASSTSLSSKHRRPEPEQCRDGASRSVTDPPTVPLPASEGVNAATDTIQHAMNSNGSQYILLTAAQVGEQPLAARKGSDVARHVDNVSRSITPGTDVLHDEAAGPPPPAYSAA